jgi:hypothetical protein
MQASMMQKKGHECGVGGGMGPGTIIARNESVCPNIIPRSVSHLPSKWKKQDMRRRRMATSYNAEPDDKEDALHSGS